jgi:hypothetical protein
VRSAAAKPTRPSGPLATPRIATQSFPAVSDSRHDDGDHHHGYQDDEDDPEEAHDPGSGAPR